MNGRYGTVFNGSLALSVATFSFTVGGQLHDRLGSPLNYTDPAGAYQGTITAPTVSPKSAKSWWFNNLRLRVSVWLSTVTGLRLARKRQGSNTLFFWGRTFGPIKYLSAERNRCFPARVLRWLFCAGYSLPTIVC